MRALLLFLTALAAGTSSPQDPIRTADISLRGLTKADFPRTTKLAENVYAYEQIDPTKRTVTVNNLIVITSEGVLIAESQGTVDNVTRLVADSTPLTPSRPAGAPASAVGRARMRSTADVKASASATRSAGTFSSASRTSASSSAGTLGRSARMDGTGAVK